MRRDRAVLIVEGTKFDDWTSIMVQHRAHEPYDIFNFTCTEGSKLLPDTPRPGQPAQPRWWGALQFKPGDRVQITLAGHLALTGIITTRQAAYAAEEHGVQLVGKSLTYDVARSSVIKEKMNFDNQGFSQIATQVLAPFGIQLKKLGGIDETKFDNMQVQAGELAFSFLERIARMRKIELGSGNDGTLLAVALGTRYNIPGDLIEGVNILRANCTLSEEGVHSMYSTIAQSPGNDDIWGDAASKIHEQVSGPLRRYAPLLIPMEHPGNKSDARKRVEWESAIRASTQVSCDITVWGWETKHGGLWRVWSRPWVRSPMLLLDDQLDLETATFQQSEQGGTTTTLHLVSPMRGHINYSLQPGPR